MLDGKSILITGGTGSLGKKLVELITQNYKPKRLVVFSRDELKQFEMSQTFSEKKIPCLRYFLGDIRDKERLYEAFDGIEVIFHAAAIKQVPAAEYNPFECINTNVLGAQNIIRAAIKQKVQRVIALSTDKAASPVNLYGASKLCSDKLFIAGNAMSGKAMTRFCVVRYGNVFGSRGSVVPFFLNQKESGELPITDERMTRFSITIEQAASFVINCSGPMQGGEIFVPKIPSYRIVDLAKAIAPEASQKVVGIRPGEKINELLISNDDARHTLEFPNFLVIQPAFTWWESRDYEKQSGGKHCPEEFSYSSDNNTHWLSIPELKKLVQAYKKI